MKNHYVSQFVIRRFSNAINIFDIHSGKIDESKRPNKVFYKKDIFDEEIERLINFNIESRVSNLLDSKILGKETVELTRNEIELLKRYMLICSVRTLSEEHFASLLRNSFSKNANQYISFHNEYSRLPSSKSLNIDDKELYLRSLKVFAQTTNIRDIVLNPLATREMLVWAVPFLESYIAFWDAPSDKEFLLTDCGMCSEYEGFHMITGGIDISKTSYLFHKILKEKQIQYSGILASCFVMYENYNLFVLSSTRSIVMINPFFRMFHHQQVMYTGAANEKYELDCPDIWPAVIQSRALFNPPKNKYVLGPGLFTPDDLFIYNPKTLNNEDLTYINALMLSYSKAIIGFNDATKIVDSIYYFVWQKSNFDSVKERGESDITIANRFIENVAKSTFRDLCDYCDSKGVMNKTDFIILFEKLLSYIYKDFNENPYIHEYYLEREEDTAKCTALDFLGEGHKKIDVFRKMLNRIKEERKNAN